MLDFLVARLGGRYRAVATSRTPGAEDETAGFLYDASALDLEDHRATWLGPPGCAPGDACWDAMYPRTFEAALFRVRGAEALPAGGLRPFAPRLRALNTHLDHEGQSARRHSAGMLAEAVRRAVAEAPGAAQVLCGDFNSPKGGGNEVYRILAGEAGLRDAAREAAEVDLAPSTIHKFQGPAFASRRGDGTVELAGDPGEEEDASHIDWILWRDGSGAGGASLRPRRCEVVTEALASGRYPSDHFPVSATFELRCAEG